MKRFLVLLLLVTTGLPALGQDVPLPRQRPEAKAEVAVAPAEPQGPVVPFPRRRPDAVKAEPTPAPVVEPKINPEQHIEPVDDVPAAPPRVYQSACPAMLSGLVEAKALPPIAEAQCGTQSPLALTGVMANGRMVPVSGGVTTSCNMATAMPAWIAAVDSYVFAKENTRIAEVLVGTSYMCRNVNNASAGNLSFHAFADALDVTGFKLDDGRTVTVEGGWSDALSNEGRLLRFAHDSACASFTTTLGPEANALHQDHLHVDLGCHGKTCTARLCE